MYGEEVTSPGAYRLRKLFSFSNPFQTTKSIAALVGPPYVGTSGGVKAIPYHRVLMETCPYTSVS